VVPGRDRAADAVGRRGGSAVRPVHRVGIHFYAHTRAHRCGCRPTRSPPFVSSCGECSVFRVLPSRATANQQLGYLNSGKMDGPMAADGLGWQLGAGMQGGQALSLFLA
jgi:hypothetical protein